MLTACLGQGQDATGLRPSRMTDPFNAEANPFFLTTNHLRILEVCRDV